MNDHDRRLLEARARRLAVRPAATTARERFVQVAVVEAGGRAFGVPVDGLRELVALPPLTPLPGPAGFRGLAQVRGELLGVFDLAQRAGADPSGVPGRWLAVLLAAPGPFGLVVETVRGHRDVYRDELAPDLRPPGAAGPAVLAVTRDLVTLLDVERLARTLADDATPSERTS